MAVAKFLQPICEEIKNDPLGIGYADMTDQEVADSLNKTVVRLRPVPMGKVQEWATKMRLPKRFADKNLTGSSLERELELLVQGKQTEAHFDSPGAQGIFQDLIENNIVTQEEINELVALGQYETTRAKELGVDRVVVPGWVSACRGE